MIDEKIIKLQHLFSADAKIKKEMLYIAPTNYEQYINETAISKYTNILNDSLIYIFNELKCISSDIFGCESNVFSRICCLEEIIKSNFYSCGYDINKLKLFYQRFISNMESSFITEVKAECVGYSFVDTSLAEKATSINEMLHFIHSYVINNDSILKSISILNEKTNEYGYPIRLRGVKSSESEQLLLKWPTSLDCGFTDIVALNDQKIIMMVRDRGHALTIEISLNGSTARIEYFIPKLCNIEMINNLPGINRVSGDSVGATGVIEIPKESLTEILFDFISKVPTDNDMVFDIPKSI